VLLTVLLQSRRMSACVLALVLVTLSAFIHSTSAIRCYACKSFLDEPCGDPSDQYEHNCSSEYSGCEKAKGMITKGKNSFLQICL